MAEDKGDVIVARVEVTVNHLGQLNAQFSGCSWDEAIKWLELGKFTIYSRAKWPVEAKGE